MIWRRNKPVNGKNDLATKILVGLAGVLWVGLAGFFIRLDSTQSATLQRATMIEGDIKQIRADIRTITEARTQEGVENRARNTRRIEQLENLDQLDRDDAEESE